MNLLREAWMNFAKPLWQREVVEKLDEHERVLDEGGSPIVPTPNPHPQYMLIPPQGALRRSAPYTQSVNDTTYEVLQADQIRVQRGGVLVDDVLSTITVPDTGLYVTDLGLNATFSGSEEVNILRHVNGVAITDTPLTLQGGGNNKPVATFWSSIGDYQAGDIVDLRVINGDNGSFNLNVNRIAFAITKDS